MKSKYHAALVIAWLVSTALENRPLRIGTLWCESCQPKRITRGKTALGMLNRFGDFFSTFDSQGTELGHLRIE
jgi:hypothetical protein